MKDVINLDKLSPDSYRMPANTLGKSTLDNITQVQLRYDNFLSPNIIQCVFVPGENSTVKFTIPDALIGWHFKAFVSENNGTSYTERKTWGGDDGKKFTGDAFLNANDFANGQVIGVTGGVFAGITRPYPLILSLTVSQAGTAAPSVELNDAPPGIAVATGANAPARSAVGAYNFKLTHTNQFSTFAYLASMISANLTGTAIDVRVPENPINTGTPGAASFNLFTFNSAGVLADNLLDFQAIHIIDPQHNYI